MYIVLSSFLSFAYFFFVCNEIKSLSIPISHVSLQPFIDVYFECRKIVSLFASNVRNFSFISFLHTNSSRIVFMMLIVFLCCDSLLLISAFCGSFVSCDSFVFYDLLLSVYSLFQSVCSLSLSICSLFLRVCDSFLSFCDSLLRVCDSFLRVFDSFLSFFDSLQSFCDSFLRLCDSFLSFCDSFLCICQSLLCICDSFLSSCDSLFNIFFLCNTYLISFSHTIKVLVPYGYVVIISYYHYYLALFY